MKDRAYLVLLGEMVVGHLWSNGHHSLFSFHDKYLNATSRPVLGQHFEDRLQKKARRYQGIYPWFENALPDEGGALRRHYAKVLGVRVKDSMALLAALGEQLPGAVRVVPDADGPPGLEVVEEQGLDPLSVSRFSLGGMQLKFAMSGTPDRLSLGVADGVGSEWILKIGTSQFSELAENEHSTMRWCAEAGFDVPESHVVDLSAVPGLGVDRSVDTGFLIRRYDRVAGGRIHQEDFAQVLNVPPDRKYEAADASGLVLLALQILGEGGALECIRRLVLTVGCGNCDGHLKNWSLLYLDGWTPTWSPLYDQVCTVRYDSLETKLSLRIGRAKYIREVQRDSFRWLGGKCGLSSTAVDEAVDSTLSGLASSFSSVEMAPMHEETLRSLWAAVPLLREFALS